MDLGYMAYNSHEDSFEIFQSIDGSESGYNLLFGHRRLSILDLSKAGAQPMSYSEEKYCITTMVRYIITWR